MHIKKGRNRAVLVFPRAGFVIKFPIIRVLLVIKVVLKELSLVLKDKRRMRILKLLFQYGTENPYGIKGWLFGAILMNWREYLFYQNTRNQFLVPTAFSFYGLLNIQKYGALCQMDGQSFWGQMYQITNGDAIDDGHHFSEPRNFAFDGTLRIFDYGNESTQVIVRNHGLNIVRLFNSNL